LADLTSSALALRIAFDWARSRAAIAVSARFFWAVLAVLNTREASLAAWASVFIR
jgi:hypothetical protein